MASLPTIMEEPSDDQVLTKLCDYKNLTFYITKIPDCPYPEDFLSNLKSKDVRLLVSTDSELLNCMSTFESEISEAVVNFSNPNPEGFVMDLFIAILQRFVSEAQPVSIGFETSDNGGFIMCYALIQLGMDWKKALRVVKKASLKLIGSQVDLLRKKCLELKKPEDEY